MATNASTVKPISETEAGEFTNTNQNNGELSSLHQERNIINSEIANALEGMCDRTTETDYQFSPVQKYIMGDVTKILMHQIQPNGNLYFQVNFNTNEFGGIRWMSASWLRYRSELVASYWNERALQVYQENEARRRLLEMETTVFGIYDF